MNYVVVAISTGLLGLWVHLVYRWRLARPDRPLEHLAMLAVLVSGFLIWALYVIRAFPVNKAFLVGVFFVMAIPNALWLHRKRLAMKTHAHHA